MPPTEVITSPAVMPAPEHLSGVRDSKELTRAEREVAARRVRRWAVAVGVGHAGLRRASSTLTVQTSRSGDRGGSFGSAEESPDSTGQGGG